MRPPPRSRQEAQRPPHRWPSISGPPPPKHRSCSCAVAAPHCSTSLRRWWLVRLGRRPGLLRSRNIALGDGVFSCWPRFGHMRRAKARCVYGIEIVIGDPMTEKGYPFSLRYLLVTRIRAGFRPAAELPVKPLCLTLILIQEDPPTGDGLLPFGCGKPCRRDYVPPAAKAFRNERPADHVSGIGGRANSLCLPADIIQKLLIAVAGVVSGELRIHRAQRLFGFAVRL